MRWIAKALLQKVAGALPWRDDINYWLQRRVTRSLPVSRAVFLERARNAFHHLEAFRRHGRLPLPQAQVFEFGAGWDLEMPLLFAAAGATSQVVIDRRRLMREELVAHNLRLLRETAAELSQQYGRELSVPREQEEPLQALRDRNIQYLLADLEQLPFKENAFDFLHNTWTLDHLPADRLGRILGECRRVLKPGGIVSCIIETQDAFAAFDPSITPYNYLRYTPRQWTRFNSPLIAQNRLRADDFYALFEAAGFEIVEKRELQPPEEYWRSELARLKLAEPFRDQRPERLAVTVVYVVLRRKD